MTNSTLSLSELKTLGKASPRLVIYFRNQQRFLHLYVLAQGEHVTAAYIEKIVQALDATRSFSPQTYYGLRQELHEGGWIEQEIVEGRAENPHFITPARLDEFRKQVTSAGLVERPITVDKVRLFELGRLLARLQTDTPAAAEIEAELRDLREQQADADVYYPDYILHGLTSRLAERAEQLERAMAALESRASSLARSGAGGPGSSARFTRSHHRPHERMASALDVGYFEVENPARPPNAEDCVVLIALRWDDFGNFRLNCSLAWGVEGRARVHYRLAGKSGYAELREIAHGLACDTGLTGLQPLKDIWEALADLTVTVVGAAEPPVLLTLRARAADPGGPITLTVQSTGTGLRDVDVQYLFGGLQPRLLREALDVTTAIEDDHERAKALATLAPFLPPDLLQPAQIAMGATAPLPAAQAGDADLWTVTTCIDPPASIRKAADAFYVWLQPA